MSQALLTNSSIKYSDDYRSEAQLSWTALLLASFALGAVFVWSLFNQQLLMPSLDAHDTPIAQLSPLPNRLAVAGVDSSKVNPNTNSETAAVETTTLEATEWPANTSSTASATTAISTVVEAQSEISSIIDTPVEVADVNEATLNEATANQATVNEVSVNEASVNEATVNEATVNEATVNETTVNVITVNATNIEVDPVESAQADLEQMESSQVELVETKVAQTENKPAMVAVVEDRLIDDSVVDDSRKRIDLRKSPILEPGSKLIETEVPAKHAQDTWLSAELAALGQEATMLPVNPSVTPSATLPFPPSIVPSETAFEKLRREELAMLANYSEKLQVVAGLEVLDSTETPQLFQIFDLLFLYSETSVSVTIQSNDTDSLLRNIMLAQQRGDRIVDSLVLSGLDRSRFDIIAESLAELPQGSHRIAIQATLE